jgi:uncharacterized phosphosugar-binding protein
MKRRTFASAGLAGLAAGALVPSSAIAQERDSKTGGAYTAAVKTATPYGVQYYEKALGIWNREISDELSIIAQAADRAALTLKNGGKLYSHAHFGHMLVKELRVDRPGNPGYLPTWNWQTKDEEYDPIGKGDFLFFDYTKARVKKAHDRGAFTVGVRVPYLPNKTTPKGVLATYEMTDNLLTEDCSDLVLTSGAPFTNGALYFPEIPAVRGCPISVQGTGNFYWMLSAEIAVRDKGGASQGTSAKAREYMGLIKARGAKIRANFESIDGAARLMAESVASGGRYWNYTFGNEMADENTYRASGISMSRNITPNDIGTKTKAGDFAIIGGEASDTKENIEAAKTFKAAGVKVIYIGPAKTEGGAGPHMPEFADRHIETFSPERDGAIVVKGFDKKICPTTGIFYALCLWMTNAQFVSCMIAQDMTPGLDMGGHLIGGNGYNNVMRPIVEKRGY